MSHEDGTGRVDTLMTPEEVMGMLKIRKSTLYAWVARNAIPYVKLESTDDASRGLLRFLRSDVLAWLSKRKRGGLVNALRPAVEALEDEERRA